MSGQGTICCEEWSDGWWRQEGWDKEEIMEAWDDVNGKPLDPKKVEDARRIELEYFENKGVGELVW